MTDFVYVNEEARCVTQETIEEIAAWCRGNLGIEFDSGRDEGQQYILVDAARFNNVEEHRAFVGDWIFPLGETFSICTDEQYQSTFLAAKRNRKKYIQILEIVADAISAGAPHAMHGVGVNRDLVAEQAALKIMQVL